MADPQGRHPLYPFNLPAEEAFDSESKCRCALARLAIAGAAGRLSDPNQAALSITALRAILRSHEKAAEAQAKAEEREIVRQGVREFARRSALIARQHEAIDGELLELPPPGAHVAAHAGATTNSADTTALAGLPPVSPRVATGAENSAAVAEEARAA